MPRVRVRLHAEPNQTEEKTGHDCEARHKSHDLQIQAEADKSGG
jgi:hypothetical protein